jgi:hypothetical protein
MKIGLFLCLNWRNLRNFEGLEEAFEFKREAEF